MATLNRYNYLAPYNILYQQNIDNFRDEAAKAWASQLDSIFSTEQVFTLLDGYARQFTASGAWQREREKWNNNPVPLTETIHEELDYVKNWYQRNYDNLCSQFGVDKSIDLPSISTKQTVYMLDGRRLNSVTNSSSLPRGIYIIDKRKVIIR